MVYRLSWGTGGVIRFLILARVPVRGGATCRATLGLGDPVPTGECCGADLGIPVDFEASRIYLELVPVCCRVLEPDITARMNVRHPLLVLIAGPPGWPVPWIHEVMQGMKMQSRAVPAS